MKILLLAATELEVYPFLKTAPRIDVLIGGVGIANTLLRLSDQLQRYTYDLVIQAGIAGAFNGRGIAPGAVVTVKQDCFGDLGAYEHHGFSSTHDMGLDDHHEWLINEGHLLNRLPYEQVRAITVNTVTDDERLIGALDRKWMAQIESMEGAALHRICNDRHLPYLQLRAISNMVGQRDKSLWKMKEAIEHLNQALHNIVTELLNP